MTRPRVAQFRSALLAAAALAFDPLSATAQAPTRPAELQTFASHTRTFTIDLPPSWRQLAPGEVPALQAALPNLPADLRRTEPRMFYPVGPVDRWLAGDFDGVYLQVHEQDNEWHLEADLAERLRAMWRDKGRSDGVDYAVDTIDTRPVGRQGFTAVVCERRSTPPPPGVAQWSLDVHTPTGGRQLSLSFTCRAADRTVWAPRFGAMLATLSLPRKPHGEVSLFDRLLWPLVGGAIVGTVFIVLYRHNQKRRFETPGHQG